MTQYTDSQIESFISTRTTELSKKDKDLRNCRQQAAMEWEAHTGRIDKRSLPKGWKDPYAKLDKASKNKAKTATKAKKK